MIHKTHSYYQIVNKKISKNSVLVFNAVHSNHRKKKMSFSIKDFFNKCDQVHDFPQICSHLLTKTLMKSLNFIFCAVNIPFYFQALSYYVVIVVKNLNALHKI